jgi:hypothetical protein
LLAVKASWSKRIRELIQGLANGSHRFFDRGFRDSPSKARFELFGHGLKRLILRLADDFEQDGFFGSARSGGRVRF